MSQSQKIRQLNQILEALEEFKHRKNYILNFSKLASLMKISNSELEEIMNLILRFQYLFKEHFNGKVLSKKWKNNQFYFKLISELCDDENRYDLRKQIEINVEHSQLLNDIIYCFQHVNIGKGFDIKHNITELPKKVKKLYAIHPYFFENRGNGLIYPTNLAIELGKAIRTYNKINREVRDIRIEEYRVKIR